MATLSRMTKKAASSIIPLANRRNPHRNYTSASFVTTPLMTCTTISATNNLFGKISVPTHHHFSARAEKKLSSDDTLLSMIEPEIECSEDKFREFAEAPREFYFKIEDNVERMGITLTREYQGEEIKARVYGPPRDHKRDPPQYVRLNVSISKKSGLTLEVKMLAHADDRIRIHSRLRVKNPNVSHDFPAYAEPEISDLDENLQKAFYKYLEVRGFEPNIGKFLCDYMVHRKHMIHATWLKCLKNFIAISSRNSNLFRKVSRETSIPAHHPFSSLAEKQSNSDDTFLNVVKSEIERGEEEFHEVVAEALSDFPFKIEGEDVGERTITLTREYQGDEEIKVTVHIKHYCGRYVDLKGTVSNKTGLTLDFHGTIDATNGFEITSLDVKDPNSSEENTPSHCYGGPAFLDLDEKFKNAFRTYLEDRGIEPSITEVLYDCMVEMKHKKHTGWLKQLKNFLAN